jgi:hypothetical protein
MFLLLWATEGPEATDLRRPEVLRTAHTTHPVRELLKAASNDELSKVVDSPENGS